MKRLKFFWLTFVICFPAIAQEGLMLQQAQRLRWTVGVWEGTRMDGSDSSRASLKMEVREVLGGRGYRQEIEIDDGRGIYRGHATDVFNPAEGVWIREYINATTGTFVAIKGSWKGSAMVWSSSREGRISRMISEQLEGGRWRRTMHISTDGGGIWRVLWQDELKRTGD